MYIASDYEVVDGVFDVGLIASGEPGFGGESYAGYAGDDETVFYTRSTDPGGKRVINADPKTFMPLGHHYGRDATHVFYEHVLVRGANPRSFYVINNQFAADERFVFRYGRRIDGADPLTFMLLWDKIGWAARDQHRYYRGGRVVASDEYAKSLRQMATFLQTHATAVESGNFEKDYFDGCVRVPR